MVPASMVLNELGTSMACTLGKTWASVAVKASTRRRSLIVRPTLIITTPSGAR